MELKQFVKVALIEITQGVREAQDVVSKSGGYINPLGVRFYTSQQDGRGWTKDGNVVQNVTFDVAVVVQEESSNKSGVGIFVGPFGFGTQGNNKIQDSAFSRMKFDVPILLPGMSINKNESNITENQKALVTHQPKRRRREE